ncbi:hypothetical protein O1611_g7679 [Lasiodiplodia mahajangana]|uniref:Uncharacterized protein n=1 Tax=Lasiodiplodia mahajangana TaxID=1108764 RepID=A0ACC2JEP7_9PEZI|nr:hypothetical protein O1611_g7679 [Lasiodiplodia mahajangana]
MDPFAAVGFASNVLSFVDFSWELFVEARTIYKSASGLTPSERTIETIAEDVTRLSTAITLLPVHGSELQHIAKECRLVADDLLSLLEKIRVPAGRSKYGSFLSALQRIWKRKDLDAFTGRLQKLQLQLMIRIHWMLLSENSKVVIGIKKIEDFNRKMDLGNRETLKTLKDEAVRYLSQLESEKTTKRMADIERSIVEWKRIDTESFQSISQLMQGLAHRMSNLEQSGREANDFQELLKSLYFDAIQTRQNAIEEAHTRTFEWMFNPPPSSNYRTTKFVEWLRGENNVFWIQGKAGSGKSTLMKFLCQHREIQHHLTDWAQNKRLVVAQYFFWNSGSSLEKSQEGLLRTLLFEILRVCPELGERVKACRYYDSSAINMSSGWTRRELLNAVKELPAAGVSAKFCFFIDGLDEYKGDSLELLGTIQRLSCLPDIKICTSSRPWTQFVDAFGGNRQCMVKLEDLTRTDIHRYVFDRLYTNKRFKALTRDISAYANLANEVVARAQGVFLWVVLVIRSLLEGATYADSLNDMHRRLEAFPKDLETYFQRMIDDVPEVYRPRTALTLRVALAADGPLPLSTYYFIDELFSDPDFALRIERRVVTGMEYNAIRTKMTARLDGRCKGLLEVVSVKNFGAPWRSRRVDFLHRTVKDFLLSSGTESVTLATVSESFNPYCMLCHAFLAEAKWTRGNLTRPVEDFANYAALVKEEDIEPNRLDLAFYDIEDNAAKGGNSGQDSVLEGAIALLNDPEVVDSRRLPSIIRSLLEIGIANNAIDVNVTGKSFINVWLPQRNRSPEIRGQVHEILKIFFEHGLDQTLRIPSLSPELPDIALQDYIRRHLPDRQPRGFASLNIPNKAI